MVNNQEEQTLVIIKPDAIHRSLLGEIVGRFEKKGLKIIGMKMMEIGDLLLEDHYSHHKDKPFFASLKKYMQSAPVVVLVLSGFNAVSATRLIVGPTAGYAADAGSIRGDFSMSVQSNLVHASDSPASAAAEVARFFRPDELFTYQKHDFPLVYSEHRS